MIYNLGLLHRSLPLADALGRTIVLQCLQALVVRFLGRDKACRLPQALGRLVEILRLLLLSLVDDCLADGVLLSHRRWIAHLRCLVLGDDVIRWRDEGINLLDTVLIIKE